MYFQEIKWKTYKSLKKSIKLNEKTSPYKLVFLVHILKQFFSEKSDDFSYKSKSFNEKNCCNTKIFKIKKYSFFNVFKVKIVNYNKKYWDLWP